MESTIYEKIYSFDSIFTNCVGTFIAVFSDESENYPRLMELETCLQHVDMSLTNFILQLDAYQPQTTDKYNKKDSIVLIQNKQKIIDNLMLLKNQKKKDLDYIKTLGDAYIDTVKELNNFLAEKNHVASDVASDLASNATSDATSDATSNATSNVTLNVTLDVTNELLLCKIDSLQNENRNIRENLSEMNKKLKASQEELLRQKNYYSQIHERLKLANMKSDNLILENNNLKDQNSKILDQYKQFQANPLAFLQKAK